MAISIGHRLRKNDRIIVFQPDNHHAFKSGTLKGYVYEHIYNAECKLGRELLPGEVVHHIDENKVNNDPENLLIFKSAHDHAAFHGNNLKLENLERLADGSFKVADGYFKYGFLHKRVRQIVSLVCETCGREFESPKDGHRGKHIYCCIQCANAAKRK